METLSIYKSDFHTTATITRRMGLPYYGAKTKAYCYNLAITADYDNNALIYFDGFESLADCVHYLFKNFAGFNA